jgi:fumarate reductase subunit D
MSAASCRIHGDSSAASCRIHSADFAASWRVHGTGGLPYSVFFAPVLLHDTVFMVPFLLPYGMAMAPVQYCHLMHYSWRDICDLCIYYNIHGACSCRIHGTSYCMQYSIRQFCCLIQYLLKASVLLPYSVFASPVLLFLTEFMAPFAAYAVLITPI